MDVWSPHLTLPAGSSPPAVAFGGYLQGSRSRSYPKRVKDGASEPGLARGTVPEAAPALRGRSYFANSVARDSRITVTLIWPGYSSVDSISRAISRERSTAMSSSTSPGLTITRRSRPACIA